MLVVANRFGEQTSAVSGVYMRKRRGDQNVSLWLSVDDKAVRRAIADVLYGDRDAGIPPEDKIKWQLHSMAIEGKSKFVSISRPEAGKPEPV